MNSKHIFSVLFLLLLTAAVPGSAQSPFLHLLDRFRASVQLNDVQYQYKVSVTELSSGKTVDQLRGELLRKGQDYRDSNNARVVVCQGGTFLELDLAGRTGNYCEYQKLARRYNMSQNLMSNVGVPDSILAKYALLNVDSTSEPACFIVSIDLKKAELVLDGIRLWVRKSDYALSRLWYTYSTDEQEIDRLKSYRYEFLIYGIEPAANRTIDIKKYLSLKSGKPRLQGQYSGFSLNQIL